MIENERQSLEKTRQFADLSAYSFKQRFLIRAADLAFYSLIQIVCRTVRFQVSGWEHWEKIERDGKQPIICFWHDNIFLGTFHFRRRGIVVMTSQSFDGEYIARFIQRFGYGAVRGSSTRGGIGALIELIKLMKTHGAAASMTVDGPKGPRRVVKDGVILLAKKTGNPLLPFVVTPRRRWTVKSWDKMQIPHPFTTAKLEIAAPVAVAADADETELTKKRAELQNILDDLARRGEDWREN